MNEMEVYLVSEYGEVRLGTVWEITHDIPNQLASEFSMGAAMEPFLGDLVSEIASREAGDYTFELFLQLRHPTGE